MKIKSVLLCFFILTCLIVLPVHSRSSMIDVVWSIEFDDFYKNLQVGTLESHGVDKYGNVLLVMDAEYDSSNYFIKINKNGDEIVRSAKPEGAFWIDPIMDRDGNVFTDMRRFTGYNCTYMKFDSNMTFLTKITIGDPYDDTDVISNRGNIYSTRTSTIEIGDVFYRNTTLYSLNSSGLIEWELSFLLERTRSWDRDLHFRYWKYAEDERGYLIAAKGDDLVLIDTINKTVEWQRKIDLDIYSITQYLLGVNVIHTNYTHGPVICTQISNENELLNNFTLSEKSMYNNYFARSFNSKYYFMNFKNKRNFTDNEFKIYTTEGNLIYEDSRTEGSIVKIYSSPNSLTEFYSFEKIYNETSEEAIYYLKLNSFERILKKLNFPTSLLYSILSILVIIPVIYYFYQRRKKS